MLDTTEKWDRAYWLSRRFARLAATVAWRDFGVSLDTVSDLSRVLRVPGTWNHKDPDNPSPVGAMRYVGAPLTLDEIEEFLDEIEEFLDDWMPQIVSDAPVTGPVISPPEDWQLGPGTCAYVSTMLNSWHEESDRPRGGRHQWALDRCVRLVCAHRLGCITEDDLRDAVKMLERALAYWCATTEPKRELHPNEITDAYRWAMTKVATFTDCRTHQELGTHRRDHNTGDGAQHKEREEPEEKAEREPENRLEPRNRDEQAEVLKKTHQVFMRWLGEKYDLDALDAALAAAAVERFNDDSDPVWLLIISGPGAAKTETVQPLQGAGAVLTSSISSEAALLSATPKKERAKDATGGLLRKIGDRGVLVIKDVTSILSMNRDMRAKVLAALREVYDGRWVREVGTEGGRSMEWRGRICVIGAVTTAWDSHHAVVSAMGDRFVLVRIDSSVNRLEHGRRAIANTGSETTMRKELSKAVADILSRIDPEGVELTENEEERLLTAANLVTMARTGVDYDYRGEVIDAHAPESPTRFAKQLAQVVRGGVAIGLPRRAALRLALRCARDSMPPMRLAILDDVAKHPRSTTANVKGRLDKPRTTIDRQLQALHILGVLTQHTKEGSAPTWMYELNEGIDPHVLAVPDE